MRFVRLETEALRREVMPFGSLPCVTVRRKKDLSHRIELHKARDPRGPRGSSFGHTDPDPTGTDRLRRGRSLRARRCR